MKASIYFTKPNGLHTTLFCSPLKTNVVCLNRLNKRWILRFKNLLSLVTITALCALCLKFQPHAEPVSCEPNSQDSYIQLEGRGRMIRLQTYSFLSLIAALVAIYHAFHSRIQFYPAMVYLSNSKISLVLLLNMGLVLMCFLWQVTKLIFLGSLREAEVERLNEQSWREAMEILFAITIFRQDFSVTFMAMVTALLLIKALHWLAQKRVEYIETTPTVPLLSHIRIVSFIGFLLLLDCLFLWSSIKYLIQTRQASVSLLFSFEYMILATTTISTFVKYCFYVSDMLMEGQWERKAVYTFYLELIRDLLHLSMYLCFFFVIFMNYGVPLHLIRELYETFRNFKIRVADYIRYRKITSNMNDRFTDATPEELNATDITCIICREEMTTAKKLICGHIFHVHCLRSWLERQNTCPTCRALVVPSENGTTARGQHGSQRDAHQQGTAGTDAQGPSSGVANDDFSRHQARLQAAVAAAAVYEKSFVYPYGSSQAWSCGYASVPQALDNIQQILLPSETTPNLFSEFPGNHHVPFQTPDIRMDYGDSLGNNDVSHDTTKQALEHQIEELKQHLDHARKIRAEKKSERRSSMESSDNKGKAVASSVSGHQDDNTEE